MQHRVRRRCGLGSFVVPVANSVLCAYTTIATPWEVKESSNFNTIIPEVDPAANEGQAPTNA